MRWSKVARHSVDNFFSINTRENVQLQPHNIILLLMFYITSTLHSVSTRITAIRPSVVTVIPVMKVIPSSWI